MGRPAEAAPQERGFQVNRDFIGPPAIVRPGDELADLARQFNAEHEAGGEGECQCC